MTIPLHQIAQLVAGRLSGKADCSIHSAAPIDTAAEGQITFAEKGPGLKRLAATQASAVLVPEGTTDPARNLIETTNPRLAFAKVVALLHPVRQPAPGIHSAAVIGKDCRLGRDVAVGAGVVLGDRVTLGNNVVLHPLVVVGDDASIGDDTIVYPHVAILERCVVGRRVIIHAGTVIGSDGYGFVQDGGRHHKINQIGIVRIDDDVEIGANNTIDRAAFGETWIQTGVKTDNLIQIGHNVVVGAHTLIVAQVGISGSTTVGRHVILAGQAGLSGHLTIGDGAIVGPQTGVGKSVPDNEVVSGGISAMPHRTWLRLQPILPQLPELNKRIKTLEKRLAELEERKATDR